MKTSNHELMLLEHFRCHEEIMNCFNAFMYGNKLQPCRQKENILVPSLFNSSVNYSIVSNSRSTQVNASRTNEIEADAVIEFLKYIANTIIGAYETKDGKQITIDKIFAILTPFRAQARLIKTKLLKEFKQYPKIENMTVDTIHSLQGAERPVILYSTVYGDNDSNCRFIDDNKELSNVVMSRAQDLLVVFCAKKQLNNSASDFFKIIKKSGEALD